MKSNMRYNDTIPAQLPKYVLLKRQSSWVNILSNASMDVE